MKNILYLPLLARLILLALMAWSIASCERLITIKTSQGRYVASDHLTKINGKEKLASGILDLLHEEQNLHNKDLWGPNANTMNINPDYVPEKNPKFPLPYYLIPQEQAHYLQASSLDARIASQLVMKISGTNYYKLFVHPESEAHYNFLKNAYRYIGPAETEFLASPTYSYRSLVVWNQNNADKKPFIAKISLDKNVIGSIDRLVSENEVERSVTNQKVFDHIGKKKLDEINVKIFPESAGLIISKDVRGAPGKLGGQIIREIPDEVMNAKNKWLSFSALMSPNKKPRPLIALVIEASGLSSYDFFEKYMIKSYMTMFEELSFKRGVNFEPHSQNLSFETTKDFKPTGKWVIRDFGAVWPDVTAMAKASGPVHIYMESASAKKFKFRFGRGNYISSYVYFYKRQVFDPMILEVAKHDPTLTQEKIEKLKAMIDQTFLDQVNTHLKLKLKDVPTMSNYKMIEEMVIDSTFIDKNMAKTPIANSAELQTYIKEKKTNEEWVELAKVTEKSEFFLTDHAVYEVVASKVIGMALFNLAEWEDYKTNNGHLSKLKPLVLDSGKGNCWNMMTRFF